MAISIKTIEEIKIMREGGQILAQIIAELKKAVKPGITTFELERLAEGLVFNFGVKSSFKGYRGQSGDFIKPYPACLCTSVNAEIVHAIPSERVLRDGDIISLDMGIFYKGFHTDMAITVAVGNVSEQIKKLIEVTEKSLEIGISKIKPGILLGEVSKVIQKYIESNNFNVVRELCGHGIGKNIHEDPEILNSVSFDKETVDKVKFVGDGNLKLKEGMILCFEPMVTVGSWHIKQSKDCFGWETRDGSLSCHFEHTIAVIKDGHEVLTKLK